MSVSRPFQLYTIFEYTNRPPVGPAVKPRWTTGAARGMPDAERAADAVRGRLIARIDHLVSDRLKSLGDRYGLEDDEFLRFWQDVQVALFPEEFLDREPTEAEAGLVPRGAKGLRVRADWVAAFAARLAAKKCPPRGGV
jgi:hypothetical protein